MRPWEKDCLRQLLESNAFVDLFDPADTARYAAYVRYICQRTLYELLQLPDLEWTEFVDLVLSPDPALHRALRMVTWQVLQRFPAREFNFHHNCPVRFLEDMEDDDLLYMMAPFPPKEEESLIQFFMLRAELAQYERLSAARPGCLWEDYVQELMRNGPLLRQLVLAFQHAVKRLDFEGCWRSHLSGQMG